MSQPGGVGAPPRNLSVVNRPLVGALLLCLAVGASAASLVLAHDAPADAGAVVTVRSLESALNAHDSESVVGLFASTANVQNQHPPQTHEQIQGWIDELIRQDIHLAARGKPSESGTEVTWRVWLDLQMYRALGLAFVPATLRAQVVNRGITFLSIRPDPDWTSLLSDSAIT